MYLYKNTEPVSFYHRSKWIDWAESGYCCWRTSWIWSTAAQMLLEAKVHWCIGCWSEWGSLTYRCAGGQQHYHLWWSRNLAIWAAPRHYLVDLDGEKDQAVKKMETPVQAHWCLHAKPKKSIRYELTSIFRFAYAEEWKLYHPRYCLFGLESCILFQANVYKNGDPFNDK